MLKNKSHKVKEKTEKELRSINSKISRAETWLDRVKEQSQTLKTQLSSSESMGKAQTYNPLKETFELKKVNKKLKDSLKMKNIKLTSAKAETDKAFSVLDTESKKYRIKVENVDDSRAFQSKNILEKLIGDIDVVNENQRTLS